LIFFHFQFVIFYLNFLIWITLSFTLRLIQFIHN